MYFDAHTHLNADQLFDQREQELEKFIEVGWGWLVNIWGNHTYNTRALEIASQALTIAPHIHVGATIGLHPYEASIQHITTQNLSSHLLELKKLYTPLHAKHIRAIGEIGIDTHFTWSESTLSLQKELFWLQCQRARELALPIVIHSRSNRVATFDILQYFSDLTVYFHCRAYTPKEIDIIQTTFDKYYIGFDANISYPNASSLRSSLWYLAYWTHDYPSYILSWKESDTTSSDVVGIIPDLTHILLETDAPYLPFRDRRGKTQHPHYITRLYEYIEQLLQVDLTTQIYTNTIEYYQL